MLFFWFPFVTVVSTSTFQQQQQHHCNNNNIASTTTLFRSVLYFKIVWKRHDERHLWISAIPKKKNLSTFGRIILAACWRKRKVLSHFINGKHLGARHGWEIDNFCFIVVNGSELLFALPTQPSWVLISAQPLSSRTAKKIEQARVEMKNWWDYLQRKTFY